MFLFLGIKADDGVACRAEFRFEGINFHKLGIAVGYRFQGLLFLRFAPPITVYSLEILA